MGTRHRAALGISEVSDAVCVLVSEETGRVAITQGGRMLSRVEQDRLRALLESFYAPQSPTTLNVFNRTWLRIQSLLRRRPGKAAA